MHTDEELLRAYQADRSEAAFLALVERYVDLVFSTALRTVREPHMAEDIAQAVFVELARKADFIRKPSALPGWLYRVTCAQGTNTMRAEHRRHQREEEAMRMNLARNEQPAAWEEIAPLLEEAMQTLNRKDQDAVVLRFFHGQSLRAVGQALEVSEDAAQKRLSRALERLRDFFGRRGVKVSAGALASGLAAHTVEAAPAGISLTISTSVIASGAALETVSTWGLAKLALLKGIAMTTTQKVLVTATFGLTFGTTVFEAHRASQLQAQLEEARQQLPPLREQANHLRQERDQFATRLQGVEDQLSQSDVNRTELLRLRGEVTRLRQDAQELAALKKAVNAEKPQGEADLAARVAWLKQRLEQSPERRIPELQFATQEDWLEAAKLAKTDSDTDTRKALSLLRTLAKFKVGAVMQDALVAYTAANAGNLPTDLAQLKPFCQTPLEDTILARYQVSSAGNTGDPGFNAYRPVIRDRRESQVDSTYDSLVMVGVKGVGGGGGPNVILPSKGGVTSTVTRIGGPAQASPRPEGP